MDPLTGILDLAKLALTFGMKVYDDTPVAIRQQAAADWGKFTHNIADVILTLQGKINAAVAPK